MRLVKDTSKLLNVLSTYNRKAPCREFPLRFPPCPSVKLLKVSFQQNALIRDWLWILSDRGTWNAVDATTTTTCAHSWSIKSRYCFCAHMHEITKYFLHIWILDHECAHVVVVASTAFQVPRSDNSTCNAARHQHTPASSLLLGH